MSAKKKQTDAPLVGDNPQEQGWFDGLNGRKNRNPYVKGNVGYILYNAGYKSGKLMPPEPSLEESRALEIEREKRLALRIEEYKRMGLIKE